MAEYIEREAAIKAAKHAWAKGLEPSQYIEALPAADVAPVVHGRWGTYRFNLETGNYEKQCTRCRNFSKEYGSLLQVGGISGCQSRGAEQPPIAAGERRYEGLYHSPSDAVSA